MPIIIAAIVAYGSFTGYVIADTGVAQATLSEMVNEVQPTQEHLQMEAQQMLLDSYGPKITTTDWED